MFKINDIVYKKYRGYARSFKIINKTSTMTNNFYTLQNIILKNYIIEDISEDSLKEMYFKKI